MRMTNWPLKRRHRRDSWYRIEERRLFTHKSRTKRMRKPIHASHWLFFLCQSPWHFITQTRYVHTGRLVHQSNSTTECWQHTANWFLKPNKVVDSKRPNKVINFHNVWGWLLRPPDRKIYSDQKPKKTVDYEIWPPKNRLNLYTLLLDGKMQSPNFLIEKLSEKQTS